MKNKETIVLCNILFEISLQIITINNSTSAVD